MLRMKQEIEYPDDVPTIKQMSNCTYISQQIIEIIKNLDKSPDKNYHVDSLISTYASILLFSGICTVATIKQLLILLPTKIKLNDAYNIANKTLVRTNEDLSELIDIYNKIPIIVSIGTHISNDLTFIATNRCITFEMAKHFKHKLNCPALYNRYPTLFASDELLTIPWYRFNHTFLRNSISAYWAIEFIKTIDRTERENSVHLCKNILALPDITIHHVVKNWELIIWNSEQIADRFELKDYLLYPNMCWNWPIIFNKFRPDFKTMIITLIEKKITNGETFISCISLFCKITTDDIRDYNNMFKNGIVKHPFNYELLSANASITPAIVKSLPDIEWNTSGFDKNPNFSFEKMDSKHKYNPLCLKEVFILFSYDHMVYFNYTPHNQSTKEHPFYNTIKRELQRRIYEKICKNVLHPVRMYARMIKYAYNKGISFEDADLSDIIDYVQKESHEIIYEKASACFGDSCDLLRYLVSD